MPTGGTPVLLSPEHPRAAPRVCAGQRGWCGAAGFSVQQDGSVCEISSPGKGCAFPGRFPGQTSRFLGVPGRRGSMVAPHLFCRAFPTRSHVCVWNRGWGRRASSSMCVPCPALAVMPRESGTARAAGVIPVSLPRAAPPLREPLPALGEDSQTGVCWGLFLVRPN